MPGSIQDERNMSQTDVHMSDIPDLDTTESGSNNISHISSTVFQNRGKRTRASAGDTKSKVKYYNQV